MKKISTVLSLLIVFASTIFNASAKKDTICVTMQPSAAKGNDIDAVIVSGSPSNNYGTHPNFLSFIWTCGGNCLASSLIRFDLSSIPAGATIVSANLSLYADPNCTSDGITGSPDYGTNNAGWIQRVTSPWAINTVTWNTQPTTTTTNEVVVPQSTSVTEDYTLNVTQLITDIIASGNNYGMEIVQQNQTTPYNSLIFGSSNHSDSNLHPKIQICYVVTDTTSVCLSMQPSAAKGNDDDAVIVSGSPSNNYGTHPNFLSFIWTCGGNCLASSLIRFDLSSIPTGATITNASLFLYADPNCTSDGITGSPDYGTNNAGWIQRVTSPWAVNTVTWNTQPTTTTTNEVVVPQSTSVTEDYTLNVTQLITDIIASGNNYGMEIVQQNQTTPYNSLIFGSSNHSDSNIHPKIQICYTPKPNGIATIETGNSAISVYPNPATNSVVFNTSGLGNEMNGYYVELYNIMGENIRTFNLYPYKTTISTSDLPRGLYMYRIMKNNTSIKNGKLILQ